MANKFLLPVYKKIFGEDFSYRIFEDRLKMQKMVYLLQEEGVNIGHYGFDWYKYGPYSQVLLDDMHDEDGKAMIELSYTDDVEKRINFLKQIFNNEEGKKYGIKNWTECLASIHFLRNKEMGSSVSKNEILCMLKERKPYLNNSELNSKAYELIENMNY